MVNRGKSKITGLRSNRGKDNKVPRSVRNDRRTSKARDGRHEPRGSKVHEQEVQR